MLAAAICLAFCLTDCGAISWPASPEPDVVAFVVRVQGVELHRGPELEFILPVLTEPTTFSVVAVDAAGLESLSPRRLLVDPSDPATFMQVDCREPGSCHQYVCGGMP